MVLDPKIFKFLSTTGRCKILAQRTLETAGILRKEAEKGRVSVDFSGQTDGQKCSSSDSAFV
jgi:hypothetical protein